MKFYVGHISFVKSVQQKIIEQPTNVKKPIKLLEQELKQNSEYIPNKKTEGTGLIFGNFLFDQNNNLLSTMVGRSKNTKKPDYKNGDFYDKEDKEYPYVCLVWYEKYQLLLIEINNSFYTTHIPQVDNKSSSFCLVMILIICSGKYVLLVQ